ncbi:MAG: hypothetical protein PVG39_11510 [Desulfobacteraceae bacterium]|jgi:hypothetical protein
MYAQNTQIAAAGNDISKDESKIVKRLFMSLLLTVKNLSLYPPGHTIFVNSINQFHTQLTAFLDIYGTFKLEVERERIVYKGETISEGIPEEGTFHYTLFRDGIRWLKFTVGIEQKEITDILLLINKYTKLSAEPEGDIVTAFWEVRFPHMQYEVAELWEGDLKADKFSDLVSGKGKLTQSEETSMREKEYKGDPAIDMSKIFLTPEEEAALQEMIRMEEDADLTSYLDALLDSLLQNREELNFSKILEALSEEFTFSLTRKNFIVTIKILQGLQYVLDICKEELPWAVKLIEDFFINVSSPASLAPFKDIWKQIDQSDAVVLQDIFTSLKPEAIRVLISLLSQTQPVLQRKMLLELITLLASQDTRALELALSNASGSLLERLVAVIVNMDGDTSMKYLLKLSHHSSGRIRYEAVKGILKQAPSRIKDMLNLIDDKEDSIRQLVLEHIGQSRDDVIEEFLISYIKKNKSGNIDADCITRCFSILGRCGSLHSIPFLRETLLKWGFLPGSRRAVLRRGAAIALGTLGITQADEVLERAGRSLFPGVRGVVIKVREQLNEEADSSVR